MRRSLPVLVTLLVLAGCGGPPGGIAHGGSASPPPAITDANVYEIERTFWRMAPDDPARVAWRDALIRYRSADTDAILARGDYDEVVHHLADLTTLLTPADVGAGRVPDTLAPLARWVVEHGGQRGDEGRVMGALLLLAELGGGDAHQADRERIAEWGREARAGIRNPLERYGDLIQVWEQYEQIAPAPEVLATLAQLYVEQRDALAAALRPEGESGLSMRHMPLASNLVQRAPLDVAAVYLRHGDLAHAIEHVQGMAAESEIEAELIRILQHAQQNDERGAHALDELARGFARARPHVAAAICRLGARRFPDDARFPLCLARVAIEADEPGRATGWYAEAVRLAPDEREVYDEALGRLGQMMEEGIFSTNIAQSRSLARHALEILDERIRRWPESAPSLTRDALLLSIGRAEMTHGNVDQARERLLASLDASETRQAHEALGLLLERVGQPRESAEHYRRALDMVEARGAEGTANRAELLEHLGDAFRQAGEARQAERMYRQSLELWDRLAGAVQGPRAAVVQVRRGILLSRLGEVARAEEAFGVAMDASPSWREPYAAILSHLVITQPNLELAQRVLRRAQFQTRLGTQWKVYFALWVQAIAGRASAEPEEDVAQVLEESSDGGSWSARLAAFGHGDLAYEALVEAASDRGERAEAQFYQGARLLGAGDVDGARALFRAVLETGMVGFYEYAMAQELLRLMPADGAASAEASPPARP